MKNKTGILLINVGTPASPKVRDVRSFLSEFLNDPRVIDIPWIFRKLLVNLVIVPFRAPGSAKLYQRLWTEEGSPLLLHSQRFKESLQTALGEEYLVKAAMRYQSPSIESRLEKLRKSGIEKIIVVPMFPQYASSTTGTCMEEVMRIVSKWWVIPEMAFVDQFYMLNGFIDAFADRLGQYDLDDYDHVLFSFHGLPVRQVDKSHEDGHCEGHHCEKEITEENRFCYKATTYETARRIAQKAGLAPEKYSVSYQSRLDKDWLEPFSDKVIIQKAHEGAKKILVLSPAFVADCLETVVEIGYGYQKLFIEAGGVQVELVESLNDHPAWVQAMAELLKKK